MKKRLKSVRSSMSLIIILSLLMMMFPSNALINPLVPGAVGSLDNPGDVRIEKSAEATSTENVYTVTMTVEGKQKVDAAETDIVLVLDKSGSMAGSKINAAKDTAKDFVNTLLPEGNTSNRIGLVTFSDNASAVVPLTTDAGDSGTGLIEAIEDINTGGGTYIQKALAIAQGMISGSTADYQYIVLLSDGAPTLSTQATAAEASSEIPEIDFKLTSFNTTKLGGSGTSYTIFSPYEVDGFLVDNHGIPTLSQALIVKDSGIEVFSIAFGLSGTVNNATVADATWVLENIATSGSFYNASNADDLIDAFNDIAGSITAPIKSGVVTDPVGSMYTYVDGSISTTQGSANFDDGDKTITWTLGTVPEGTVATMTYDLALNVGDPGFESDVFYPMNGVTTLEYTDVNDTSQILDFLVPQTFGTAPEPVTLTTSVVGSGTIDPTAGDHDYAPGTTATVTATPASGWEFDRWNDAEGYTVPNASGEVQMDMDRKVEAIFKEIVIPPEPVTLTTSVVGSGTIDPTAGDHDYTLGATATITASPASGWEFDRWNDAEGFTVPDGSGKVLMDADKKVEAIFKEVVIQPGYGALHICKWVIHDEDVTLPDDIPKFEIIVTGPNGYNETVKLSHNETETLNNLVPGKYYVSETEPTGEYSFETINLTDTMTDYEVIIGEKKTEKAEIVNKYTPDPDPDPVYGSLLICKWVIHDEGVTLPTTIPDFEILITGPDDYSKTVKLSHDEHELLEGLKPGSYLISEIAPTTPYSFVSINEEDDMTEVEVIVAENQEANAEVVNKYTPTDDPEDSTGSIEIMKFRDRNRDGLKNGSDSWLNNIQFRLEAAPEVDTNMSAMVVPQSWTMTTGSGDFEDGQILFSGLPYGRYKLIELSPRTITAPEDLKDGDMYVWVGEEQENVLIEVGNYWNTTSRPDPDPDPDPDPEIIETVTPDPTPLAPTVVEDTTTVGEEVTPVEAVPLALPKTGELPPVGAYAIGSLVILAGVFMRRKFD
ncbi:MAG: VWA domain-containing protein [Acidaminobacter sp.]|uniref:InlB B-repeat-containing protein n=1 Tax=Acidaminobacter sp. TaxID=1872102 RepID=UPI0013807989|nr:VWA domain-containing protein [Acidaminobacter sp.]MZQ99613.1 VWA domain-containing protein [Acidaminobacter sp.]